MTYHKILSKKYKAYGRWHKQRLCQPTHWLVLGVFSISVLWSLFSNLIDLALIK